MRGLVQLHPDVRAAVDAHRESLKGVRDADKAFDDAVKAFKRRSSDENFVGLNAAALIVKRAIAREAEAAERRREIEERVTAVVDHLEDGLR